MHHNPRTYSSDTLSSDMIDRKTIYELLPRPSILVSILEEIENSLPKTTREVIEELKKHDPRIEVVPHEKYYIVKDDVDYALVLKKVHPSLFPSYRYCARRLFIEVLLRKKYGGRLVSKESLRYLLRGILFHKKYYELFGGYSRSEVVVEDEEVYGRIDQVIELGDKVIIVELKSSRHVDYVGVSLQVMSYIRAYSNSFNVPIDKIVGVVVYMRGVKLVTYDDALWREYSRRVRRVIELALNENLDLIPPRLSQNLEARCKNCAYRRDCLVLPDPHRNYENYFTAVGFKKLR